MKGREGATIRPGRNGAYFFNRLWSRTVVFSRGQSSGHWRYWVGLFPVMRLNAL